MADTNDDLNFKRAIALSLRQENPFQSDLERAIALSLEQEKPIQPDEVIALDDDEDETAASPGEEPQTAIENQASTNLNSMLGLNRKAMEEERLSRKRKAASISPPPPRKAPKTASTAPATKAVTKFNNLTIPTSDPSSLAKPATTTPDTKGLIFPLGTIKKTWAFRHARVGNDIKIEEILQRSTLTLAVLSSFQWDVEWLLTKVDIRNTKVVMVMQAHDEATKSQYRQETSSMTNLQLCFPSMEGQIRCMHSKLMLLSHPGYLRVVVPTANLVPYDWGEDGIMENSAFIIDLPRLKEGQSTAEEEMTFFGRELIYFLKAMGLDPTIIQSIYKFDFSATSDLAFVHTIGGVHTGDAWRRTGYCGLGRAIKELNLQTEHNIDIEYVTSSMGSLNFDFISSIYLAAQGDDGTIEIERRIPLRSKAKKDLPARLKATNEREQLIKILQAHFRIYFPTNETVANSTGGKDCGGTVCVQSKGYYASTFPKELLRDCKSVRNGMLMHNKMIFVRHHTTTDTSKDWAYVGSANCSESAWGRLVKGPNPKSPKLNCCNWECGVIVPLRRMTADATRMVAAWECRSEDGGRRGLEMFEGKVPVPMQYPGELYGGKAPWFFAQHGDLSDANDGDLSNANEDWGSS
ncbi:hypothetical protein G7Y79_00057g091050 [Physcia stellaris]|nr:hypothetical protein G7Y79_00057g091050 [Physcia stellaris]